MGRSAGSRRSTRAGHEGLRGDGRRRRPVPRHPRGRVLQHARALGLWEDHHPADDRRLRGAHPRHRLPQRLGRHRPASVQAGREHGVPVLRAVPAPQRVRERGVRPSPSEGGQGRDRDPGERDHEARGPGRVREAQTGADVRRPAATGGARARPREQPQGAAPRRAARGARPEAPQADAARAEAHPVRGRHHVHLRDARPGRGHDDVQPPGRDASGQDRADRASRGGLREPADRVRGRVPGRVEHARGRAEGGRERGRDRAALGRRRGAPPRRSRAVPNRVGREGGRASREGAHRHRRRQRDPGRLQQHLGPAPYVDVHRRQPPVQGRGTERSHLDGVGAEPRHHAAAPPGRAGPSVLAVGAHFRGAAAGGTLPGGGAMSERDDRARMDQMLQDAMRKRLSRRSVLKGAGVGVAGVSLASLLAACGEEEGGGGGNGGASMEPSTIFSGQDAEQHVEFANWPLYIDKARDDEGNAIRPSIEKFTEDTGITVNYQEDIQSNEEFFAKVQPQLANGDPTGYDIMVITNGRYMKALIDNGWMLPLDPAKRPNFDANAANWAKDPTFDPGNAHSMAWQSGITGIGVNHDLLKGEVTKMDDLLDETKVPSDSVGMIPGDAPDWVMINLGIDPETSGPEEWRQAADWLQRLKDAPTFRKFYDQGYIDHMLARTISAFLPL